MADGISGFSEWCGFFCFPLPDPALCPWQQDGSASARFQGSVAQAALAGSRLGFRGLGLCLPAPSASPRPEGLALAASAAVLLIPTLVPHPEALCEAGLFMTAAMILTNLFDGPECLPPTPHPRKEFPLSGNPLLLWDDWKAFSRLFQAPWPWPGGWHHGDRVVLGQSRLRNSQVVRSPLLSERYSGVSRPSTSSSRHL